MASKFVCDCGYIVCTNSFEGHGIIALIKDNDIDALNGPITEDDISDLWFRSQRMVECKNCGTLYLWNNNTKKYVAYRKVD